ncbi:MAG: DUF2232 domain-containing protein [Clostridia bacterium]|nr:DUF2232 domain-containing protein [Clostridia bacterium]
MIKNKFKSYAIILILTAIFTLGNVLPLGIFSLIFQAISIAILGCTVTKYHYTFVSVVCAFVVMLYSLFTQNILSGISFGVEVILYGITLGIGYNLKLSEFKIVGILAAIYSLFMIFNIKFSGTGENLRTIIASSMESLYTIYESQITQTDFKTIVSTLLDVFMKFMPSIIIIIGIVFGLWYFWFFKKLLKITKSDINNYLCFSDLHADKSLSITYLILSLLSFLMPQGTYFSDALANVITVASFVFFIFGLSYADFILKNKMKNTVLRRLMLIFLIFASLSIIGIPFIMLSILGAMDGCFDYRNRLTK